MNLIYKRYRIEVNKDNLSLLFHSRDTPWWEYKKRKSGHEEGNTFMKNIPNHVATKE